MPVSTTAIRDLLLPGLRRLSGKYEEIPVQWKKIFRFAKSGMALERTAEMRYLSYAELKTEGGQTHLDNEAGERFVYNQEHMEIALGYIITRKAIDDNLYKSQFNPTQLGLNRSFKETKEAYGAAVLNDGDVYDPNVGGDGMALFSTSHPIDGAVIANRPAVDLDLNESSLLATQTAIRTDFKDQAGLKMSARARKLIIPPALEPVAIRLTKTDLRPGTANNDVNAIPINAGGLPEGYEVYDYLTSALAWFVLTNTEGLVYMERIAYETDMQVDFITDNLLVKGYERYSFGYDDWRAAYGSFPTS